MTGKELKKHNKIIWDLMYGERYTSIGFEIKFSFKRLLEGKYPFVCRELTLGKIWEDVDGLWDSIEQWELIEKEDNDE